MKKQKNFSTKAERMAQNRLNAGENGICLLSGHCIARCRGSVKLPFTALCEWHRKPFFE